MALDNRFAYPEGTFLADLEGVKTLMLYSLYKQNGETGRVLATAGQALGLTNFHGLPDVLGDFSESIKQQSQLVNKRVFEEAEKNWVANESALCAYHPEPSETVVITGAGWFDEGHSVLTDCTTIAVGNGVNRYKPTYYMASDWQQQGVDRITQDVSDTVGVFCENAHPGYAGLGWSATGWYSLWPREHPGLSCYKPSDGVITDALMFAVQDLKAKKIILLGVEQPEEPTYVYYWQGIFVQSFAWWLSQHDIVIFNCTPTSTVTTGVVRGSIEEALN